MKDEKLSTLPIPENSVPTYVGMWVGVGGFVVGLVGIGISLYALNSTPSVFFLTISGWIAASLIALVLGFIASRLVSFFESQGVRFREILVEQESKINELTKNLAILQENNDQLRNISDYVISAAPKKARARSVGNQNADTGQQLGESDERANNS